MYKLLFAVVGVVHWLGMASGQTTVGYANLTYDCRRTGTLCANDAKCKADDGHCDCTGLAFQGYDCNVPVTAGFFEATTCPGCDADGTLYCEGANCYCKEFAYGTNCEDRRVQHGCEGNGKMNLTITPHGAFTGKMYILTKVDCDYSTEVGLGTTIDLTVEDPTCSADQVEGTDFQGRVTYNNTYEFMMEFDNQFQTEHDTIIKIMCVETEGGLVTLKAAVNIDPDDYTNIPKIEAVAAMPAGLTLVLTKDPSDPTYPLDENTILGTELTLRFILVVADYEFFEVNSLLADDCIADSGYEITLVEDGCLTAFAKSIVTNFETLTGTDADTTNPTKILHIVFDAFKFSGESNRVCFTAEAAICKRDVFPCTREACSLVVLILPDGPLNRQLSVGGEAKRRKRRESFTFQTEEFAGGSLTVGYSAQEVQPKVAQLKGTTKFLYDKTRCMQGMAFILPLVVMAVMLIVSMATTFTFCVKSSGTGKSLWQPDSSTSMLSISSQGSTKKLTPMSDPNQNVIKEVPSM